MTANRDHFIVAALSILFAALISGLFYNQILRYGYYSQLSRNNSIRVIPIEGPRGNIYDRTGSPMVSNRLSFDVAVVYQEIADRKKLVRLLTDVMEMTGTEIMAALDKAGRKPFTPVTIAEDIPREKAFALEESGVDSSGMIIETRSKRDYIHGIYASHVLGYLSQITDRELDGLKDNGYRMKDLIGRDGIEKSYESYLKGVDGGTQVEVDSRGRQTRVLGLKEPESGRDLQLTIDMPIQTACDKLLGEHKGAVVVMDPRNGEVLAMTSHPAYDPNIFVKSGTSKDRLRLLKDKTGRPMSNRAISGTYAPGSVFKIVTASAALETGRITRGTRFFCPGYYKLGHAEFDCWKKDGHGSQNLVEALMNSCNVFFYNTGRSAGVDRMEAYSKLFGFGKPTGIDLTDEVGGIAPGREWKRVRRKSGWFEGETLNYAIGQGYLAVTPMQVLNMVSVMANNGNLVRPHLVKKIGDTEVASQKPRNIGLKAGTLNEVRIGLSECINNDSGTGKRARASGTRVAGKTGTAQNPQGRTHAWFCGFAPYNDPKVAVVVFLEHGGKGGLEPASIAKGIFEEAEKRGYL